MRPHWLAGLASVCASAKSVPAVLAQRAFASLTAAFDPVSNARYATRFLTELPI